jgi:beta-xylosidase
MRATALALCISVLAGAACAETAPKPLYRDPVHDGAADASIMYDKANKTWRMFYTNRRADMKLPDPKDVAWVHGTAIGIATSQDGQSWTYSGTAKIPLECTGETLWAPEIQKFGDTYHMWLTVVPGIFSNWNGSRTIVHLTSLDLDTWTCGETLDLGSDRVIDASVVKLKGGYRLWFKDERKGSRLFAADSPDLVHWTRQTTPVADIAAEGPKVFRFKGRYWMVADAWKGLIVLSSKDTKDWTLQTERLLEAPGAQPTDDAKGQHPDVVVNNGRAFIYYFVHQSEAPEARTDPYFHQRTVLQVAELKYANGKLTVDRNARVDARLIAP